MIDEIKHDERRRHRRFTDRSLAGVRVNMVPCPPLYGEPAAGLLIDLSAGGMALLLPDIIPKNVFLKMALTLPGNIRVESVVKVRHILKQGKRGDYVHGIEFLNPSPEMVEAIEKLAEDILGCNDRFKKKELEICVSTCSFFAMCKRPQRQEHNEAPESISIETVPLAPVGGDWTSFRETFLDRLKKAA